MKANFAIETHIPETKTAQMLNCVLLGMKVTAQLLREMQIETRKQQT